MDQQIAGSDVASDVAAVVEKHPGLRLVAPGMLEGRLEFDATYEDSNLQFSFDVRIQFGRRVNGIPTLTEIGGQTEAIAKRRGARSLADLHRNSDGTACVCVKQEETKWFPPGSSLLDFVEGLARNYLFGLSYYDKHGKWPWGERSHGGLGLLEYYADSDHASTATQIADVFLILRGDSRWKEFDRQIRRPSAYRACPCGSKKPFKNCHPVAWHGVLQLRSVLGQLALNSRTLFSRKADS